MQHHWCAAEPCSSKSGAERCLQILKGKAAVSVISVSYGIESNSLLVHSINNSVCNLFLHRDFTKSCSK